LGFAAVTWAEFRDGALEMLLDGVASVWPSPTAARTARYGATPGTFEYERAYALDQFMGKVRFGSILGPDMPPLVGLEVLEIGCGHGGITCYLACLGARRVVGIDVNTTNVKYGRDLARSIAQHRGASLPIEFLEMDAGAMVFDADSFDLIIAENAFEHFADPGAVLRSAFRVLRPGGRVLVPIFSSIWSKYGLHVKHGLRVPWANLFFSEKVIVGAMRRRAHRDPKLLDLYPGLRGDPQCVRDLRRHRDLNGITYAEFRRLAAREGFRIETFRIHPTRLGSALARVVPGLTNSGVAEVLSSGAAAVLSKPKEPENGSARSPGQSP
jgi:SAM-dependent methyltransferase